MLILSQIHPDFGGLGMLESIVKRFLGHMKQGFFDISIQIQGAFDDKLVFNPGPSLNSFQAVLIDRFDTGPGNFDVEFNYEQMVWESGQASGGDSFGLGGDSARVGFSNGTGNTGTFFELPGSAINGAFLDSNLSTGLIHNSLNSDVLGRYVFEAREGSINVNDPPVADAGGPYTVDEGGNDV